MQQKKSTKKEKLKERIKKVLGEYVIRSKEVNQQQKDLRVRPVERRNERGREAESKSEREKNGNMSKFQGLEIFYLF